jgi:hypothetical protein
VNGKQENVLAFLPILARIVLDKNAQVIVVDMESVTQEAESVYAPVLGKVKIVLP